MEDKSNASGPRRLPFPSIIPSFPIFLSSSSETESETGKTDMPFLKTTFGIFLGRFIFPDFIHAI